MNKERDQAVRQLLKMRWDQVARSNTEEYALLLLLLPTADMLTASNTIHSFSSPDGTQSRGQVRQIEHT